MKRQRVWTKLRSVPDLFGVLALLAAAVPIYWDRLREGRHLSRVDLVNQFLSNYTYLGDHLRSGDLPGWNPYSNAGIPFMGDAVSGWGYLPAMLTFTILPPLPALQTNYLLHILIAGLGAYALARVIGLGVWGALTAGIAIEFGALNGQLRAVNVQAQMTAWIPCALLGVELAIRAKTLRGRACGWAIGGLALSQMTIGWTGQGSAYAFYIVGGYVFFRFVCSTVGRWNLFWTSAIRHAIDGAAVAFFGLGLAAAGLWIRFEVNRDSIIRSGDYSQAVGAAPRPRYYSARELLDLILVPDSYLYVGAAIASLAMLSFFVVRQDRWRVWLFLLVALSTVDLAIQQPLARPLLFQVHMFKVLHEHSVRKEIVLLGLPLAMLAGLTVDALARWKGDWHLLAGLACVPIFAAVAVGHWIRNEDIGLMPNPRHAAMAIGIIIGIYALIFAGRSFLPIDVFQIAQVAAIVALLAVIIWDPFGEIYGFRLAARAQVLQPAQVFDTYTATTDPNGPGGFLQAQMDREGPFRYFGYGPSILEAGENRGNSTYHGRFRDKLVIELLFSRSMPLGLQNVQGYNPVQNKRYTNFLSALNGETQNYHDANVLGGGMDSSLLQLFNVRYIIVERDNDGKYKEIAALEDDHPVVFEDDTVKILKVDDALPRAWIVHQAVQANTDDALTLVQAADFDPTATAIVEGQLPELEETRNPDDEQASITKYGEDEIELSASLRTPGLVVLSEIYARGWKAYVDGKPVTIYPTDYLLRGIPVPAGDHTIELRYAPAAISRGIAVTVATFLLLLALIAQPWHWWAWAGGRLRNVGWRAKKSETAEPAVDGVMVQTSSTKVRRN